MQPLEGIRVLDLTRLAPGPYCTMILADLGAEVVRVEEPRGPTGRRAEQAAGTVTLKPRGGMDPRSPANALFRNKKSLGLDLKAEAGRELFHRLVEDADVVVEELRPGVAARLGIDYETLSARNPRLIHCAITGYGQSGPYRDLVGHDLNYISWAGVLSLIGPRDRPPSIPLHLIADFGGGGMQAALAIMTALFVRSRTGRGQYLDVSLTDGALHLLVAFVNLYFAEGTVPGREGIFFNGSAPYYNVYEAADGKYLTIGALEPWFWGNLCRALGREDLIPLRTDHERRAEVFAKLRAIFKQKTRDEWFDELRGADVCVGKVLTLDELEHDPQLRHRGMIVEVPTPEGGSVKQVGTIPRLHGHAPPRRPAPRLGEHTDELLSRIGLDAGRIGELRRRGVVR